MLHFNNFTYYSLPSLSESWKPPPWLSIPLGILAGRLYFEFGEYATLANYLSLADTALGNMQTAAADAESKATAKYSQTFAKKPLDFLQEWLAIRRKGQDFVHTPMGYVCQGRQLRISHPFFVAGRTIGADADREGLVGLDLGGTARACHLGSGSGSRGNADYESDESVDVEDFEVGTRDETIGGHFGGCDDGDEGNDSEACSVMSGIEYS